MTEKEYRQHPAVSRSELWKIRESPEKFKYFKEHPEESTPALVLGQALHKLALQPESFYDEFAVSETYDRRTKVGKEAYTAFCEANSGKTIITAEQFQQINGMVKSMFENPMSRKILMGAASKEKEYFWIDEPTGEECKCRADIVTKIGEIPLVVDIKTTTCAETEFFMKEAVKYGYDFQSGFYCDGINKCEGVEHGFCIIAVEKEEPYAVNILMADKNFMQRGTDLFREYIGIYHECKQSGNWYGYLGKTGAVNDLKLPAYLAKEVE